MATSIASSPSAPERAVLVVEDDLDSVHSMALLIKMMGHEVQFAINGMAALDIARTFRPDIVILDIGLPDFEGDHIARQLSASSPGLENTQLIAISGLPEEHLESRRCARAARSSTASRSSRACSRRCCHEADARRRSRPSRAVKPLVAQPFAAWACA
jgi:CheY-like chemotaxis protein